MNLGYLYGVHMRWLLILFMLFGCSTTKRVEEGIDNLKPLSADLPVGDGQLCLGGLFSKVHITGTKFEASLSDGRVFDWNPSKPSFVTKDLIVDRPYTVTIRVNGKAVSAMKFMIDPTISKTVTIHRTAGYYRLVQNKNDSCKGSTLGYSISKKTGRVEDSRLFCFDYKLADPSVCG